MKYTNLISLFIALVIVSVGLFAGTDAAFGQQGTPQLKPPIEYKPISPIVGSTINIDSASAGGYLNNMFRLSIAIAGILAMIMLTFAGVEYLMAGSFSSKEEAKKKIWAAIGGVALLLCAVLILNTINPKLLEFNFQSLGVMGQNNTGTPQNPPTQNNTPQTFCATRPSAGTNMCLVQTPEEVAACGNAGCVVIASGIGGGLDTCDCRGENSSVPSCSSQGIPTSGQCQIDSPQSRTQCTNQPGCRVTIGNLCTCAPVPSGSPSWATFCKSSSPNIMCTAVAASANCPSGPSNYSLNTVFSGDPNYAQYCNVSSTAPKCCLYDVTP